ncbi:MULTISPECIES: MFS transporter [unclassified Caballeronia]|uniref:MFS transporter n=1 Tax=unclassified Caballeronia TaxID=2646786 RepID=UPI002864E35D|nr:MULTISPECIES: MFS transporter [unclassified Caballeronia]MDR5773966.1 MFS transporter [Caballeronia sp. LZ002]MDR5849401.1 MFS transporter [Caballeronia sp. LZ003]
MQTNLSASASGSSLRTLLCTTRWRMVLLLFVLYTINCIDRMSLSIAMPTIVREFHLAATMQGLILSAFFWTYSTFQIPAGWAADRFGARRMIGMSAVLWGGFQCLAAFAMNGVTLLLTRIGLGVFEAPYMPAATKLTAAWLPPAERARGVTLIDSGAPLGSALGGLLISALIGFSGSWRSAFLIVGAVTIVFGLVVYRMLRETPERHAGIDQAEVAYIREQKLVAGETPSAKMAPLSRGIISAMVVGRVGWAMVFFGLVTWGPNYLSVGRGLDIRGMGFATFIIFLAGAVGEILSGVTADWLQRHFARKTAFKILFGVSGGMSLLCLLALPFVADIRFAVAVLSLGVFFHLWGGLYWLIPAMLAPREQVGLVGGVMNFAGTGGAIIVPIVVGVIVDMTGGFTAVILFFAAAAFAYLVGSLFIDFGRNDPGARA